VVVACGGAASPSPEPSPLPTPTPDPHLRDPADLQVVYAALQKAGLAITVNNASAGSKGKEPLRRVSASLGGWPLALIEYSSARAREVDFGFASGLPPAKNDPPYTFAGLNIAVMFGPDTGHVVPDVPDKRFQELAQKLGETLDVYVGPLALRSVTALSLPVPTPIPSIEAPAAPEPSPGPLAPAAAPGSGAGRSTR
jgi:hypothetical protein